MQSTMIRSLSPGWSPGLVTCLIILGSCQFCGAFSSSKQVHPTRKGIDVDRASSVALKAALPSDFISSIGDFTDIPLLVGIPAAAAVAAAALSSSFLVPSTLVSETALSNIVKGTFLDGKELECVYKGTRDGWSATDFHEAVDGRGSGVVVARSLSGKVFGGYNPAGWRSTDDYILSSGAFLWCQGSSSSERILKYPVLSSGNAAIFDYATSGPNFGSEDLQIGPPKAAVMGGFAGPDMENVGANAGSLTQCKAIPGFTYASDSKWPVRGKFSLVEVEVYSRKL